MFSRKIEEMRSSAQFMRHLADEAERNHVEPGPITASDFSEDEIVDMMESMESSRRVLRSYRTAVPVPSSPVTREEAIAELISEAMTEREEGPCPLHVWLRSTATQLREDADALAEIEARIEFSDENRSDVMKEAKKAEWYDDAYQGFCDSMQAQHDY